MNRTVMRMAEGKKMVRIFVDGRAFCGLKDVESNQPGSDTKNDVKPKERIELEKKRKKQSTHGWTHGRMHGRAAGAETACYSG